MRIGQLVDRGLPLLLHDLHKDGFTGQLVLQVSGIQHMVYLRDGEPVYVTGKEPLLGELMIDMELLTPDNHRFSLATRPPVGQRYGFVLMRYGLASPETLQRALTEQIRLRLLPLFRLTHASYQIVPSVHDEGLILDLPLRVSTDWLIFQGMRNLDSARLDLLLQPLSHDPVELSPGAADELVHYGFTEAERPVLELLRQGPWRIPQLQSHAPGPLTLAVLYTLYVTELLRPMAPDLSLGPTTPEPALGGHWSVSSSQTFLRPIDTPQRRVSEGTVPPRAGAVPSGGTMAGRAAAADPQLLRLDIEHLAAYVDREDPFRLLRVDEMTPLRGIERALSVALRAYDPSELEAAGLAALLPQAEQIRQRMRDAAQLLADPVERRRYLLQQRAAQANTPAAAAEAEAALAAARARRYLARGKLQLKRRNFAGAALEFEEAARAQPDRGEFLGLKTWSRYNAGHIEVSLALREMQRALDLTPQSATLCCYTGAILRHAGIHDKAEEAFRHALQIQPGHRDAQAALDVLLSRREQDRPAPPINAASGRTLAIAASLFVPPSAAPTTSPATAAATAAPGDAGEGPPKGSADGGQRAPLQPVALMDVLRQPVGTGLLQMLRRPLGGIFSSEAPEDGAPRPPRSSRSSRPSGSRITPTGLLAMLWRPWQRLRLHTPPPPAPRPVPGEGPAASAGVGAAPPAPASAAPESPNPTLADIPAAQPDGARAIRR